MGSPWSRPGPAASAASAEPAAEEAEAEAAAAAAPAVAVVRRGKGGTGCMPPEVWRDFIIGMTGVTSRHARPSASNRAALLQLRLVSRDVCALVLRWATGGLGSINLWHQAPPGGEVFDGVDKIFSRIPPAVRRLRRCVTIRIEYDGNSGYSRNWALDTFKAAMADEHMISFRSSLSRNSWTEERLAAIVAQLHLADQRGLLHFANFRTIYRRGWDLSPISELSRVRFGSLDNEELAFLGRGAVQFLVLKACPEITDVTPLRRIQYLSLEDCANLLDVEPLVDVHDLSLIRCHSIKALPAMRNHRLLVKRCQQMDSIADGTVRHLLLESLPRLRAISWTSRAETFHLVGLPELATLRVDPRVHVKTDRCPKMRRVDTSPNPSF